MANEIHSEVNDLNSMKRKKQTAWNNEIHKISEPEQKSVLFNTQPEIQWRQTRRKMYVQLSGTCGENYCAAILYSSVKYYSKTLYEVLTKITRMFAPLTLCKEKRGGTSYRIIYCRGSQIFYSIVFDFPVFLCSAISWAFA